MPAGARRRTALAPAQRFGGHLRQAAELDVHRVGFGHPPLMSRSRSARRHSWGSAASSRPVPRPACAPGRWARRGWPVRSPAPRRRRPPAGEDQVHRPAVPDQPRQSHRAAVDQRHAPAPAEHPEHRVLLGDPQVAPQRQLEAAGHRVATDRGDHRLGQRHAGRAHRPGAGAVRRLVSGVPNALRSAPAQKVPLSPHSTATEAESSASNSSNASNNVGRRRAVDRVARLRPVHDHRGHRALAFDPHSPAHRLCHLQLVGRSRRATSSAAKSA